jgi:NAD(P)-dependent dehydrogenase (short-subunit alcohol dehydrogenase family)
MVLKDKRGLAITGAFGTLGTAVVGRVLAEGAVVAALDHAAAPRSASEFGDAVLIGGMSIWADAKGAKAALAQAAESLGGLDALVNIAGGSLGKKSKAAASIPGIGCFA